MNTAPVNTAPIDLATLTPAQLALAQAQLLAQMVAQQRTTNALLEVQGKELARLIEQNEELLEIMGDEDEGEDDEEDDEPAYAQHQRADLRVAAVPAPTRFYERDEMSQVAPAHRVPYEPVGPIEKMAADATQDEIDAAAAAMASIDPTTHPANVAFRRMCVPRETTQTLPDEKATG